MNGPLILIPRPMPPGRRVEVGEHTTRPTCDRCLRTSTPENPVSLVPRPSSLQSEFARLIARRDALCRECRDIFRGIR